MGDVVVVAKHVISPQAGVLALNRFVGYGVGVDVWYTSQQLVFGLCCLPAPCVCVAHDWVNWFLGCAAWRLAHCGGC